VACEQRRSGGERRRDPCEGGCCVVGSRASRAERKGPVLTPRALRIGRSAPSVRSTRAFLRYRSGWGAQAVGFGRRSEQPPHRFWRHSIGASRAVGPLFSLFSSLFSLLVSLFSFISSLFSLLTHALCGGALLSACVGDVGRERAAQLRLYARGQLCFLCCLLLHGARRECIFPHLPVPLTPVAHGVDGRLAIPYGGDAKPAR